MEVIKPKDVEQKIYTIRDVQVMLDRDLAELYQVETRVLIQAVKRNKNRFPADFIFQLSESEFQKWKSQTVISNADKMGLRRPPYAFTEHGVAMLSAVLRSEVAVQVSIQIMQAFVKMRKFFLNNASVFQRLDQVEFKQLKTEEKIEQIFKALEAGQPKPDKGIFFDGQVFDAYVFVADLIKSAEKEIILIDNYVDESVLTLLSKRKKGIDASIYTKTTSKALDLDLKKHNSQYPPITLHTLPQSHDRFLIVDQKHLYHIGASLKDLGKKWFAFSKMDHLTSLVLNQLKANE
ncbi:ORF6N domain-containing protein [Cyclobacterium jeungdonense]|uniref:ORF6N domain-containing protein n=1 Tax=Cyclobacterium jeungdonense TaxID=708087 RepID=A0ABT8C988_9BACT|nr:ORF6N domain-containing protein [Cyclobacterium jeungdonense]MDN3689051.1 ORF6N domain-containing protein [Cyclobacterium jeungdonense]